jgi:hypothetical protein
MTRFYLLFTPLLISVSLSAQGTPDFEFLPNDSISIIVPATTQDTDAVLQIHSNVATDINVRWQRNLLMITPGCTTRICDPAACYPPNISSRIFPLWANQMAFINVYLNNNTGTGNICQAVVRMDMWNIDVPNIVVPAYYIFNATSAINDVFRLEEVKVFPNPTSDYFTIQNDKVARVRMMTLDAREIGSFNATQTKTFALNGQISGIYVLIMEDNTGKSIGIAQLVVH